MNKTNLAAKYRRHFMATQANTLLLQEESYRLRYQVYVEEFGFEPAENFPDGLERDRYDEHAIHSLLRFRQGKCVAGSSRIILSSPDKSPNYHLPFESLAASHLDVQKVDSLLTNRECIGEISRLTMRSCFRQKRCIKHGAIRASKNQRCDSSLCNGHQDLPHATLCLYLTTIALAINAGLDGVFGLMEPRFARTFSILGIQFEQVSRPFQYRGTRAVYYFSRERFYQTLNPRLSELLDAICDDLDVVPLQIQA